MDDGLVSEATLRDGCLPSSLADVQGRMEAVRKKGYRDRNWNERQLLSIKSLASGIVFPTASRRSEAVGSTFRISKSTFYIPHFENHCQNRRFPLQKVVFKTRNVEMPSLLMWKFLHSASVSKTSFCCGNRRFSKSNARYTVDQTSQFCHFAFGPSDAF